MVETGQVGAGKIALRALMLGVTGAAVGLICFGDQAAMQGGGILHLGLDSGMALQTARGERLGAPGGRMAGAAVAADFLVRLDPTQSRATRRA